jgi:hypothetical protein
LFIPEEKDLGISPEHFIESIGGKVQFMAKYQTPLRSLSAFEKSEFADDWRELMRLYLVRRTRSFIKAYYTHNDDTNGRKFLTFYDGTRSYFPARIPKKVEYHFDANDPTDQYARLYAESVVEIINQLNLPRYGLGQDQYLNPYPVVKPTKEDLVIIQNLGRAGARLKEQISLKDLKVVVIPFSSQSEGIFFAIIFSFMQLKINCPSPLESRMLICLMIILKMKNLKTQRVLISG